MKKNFEVLSGWRLALFDKLMDDGLIQIKNKKLIVTNKFMKQINKKIKKRTRKKK